ncbi:MAG: nucleoside deaminase [Oscillospiraceae bacterium]
MDIEFYMRQALILAEEAADAGETPVGCVVVNSEGSIIGRGRNRTEELDATCHAEMEAIRQASGAVGDWRLSGCSLFVTMEPCPMCAGGILLSRISRLYYGARDKRLGSCGSVINLFMENYGRSPEIYGGILEKECIQILNAFFRKLR